MQLALWNADPDQSGVFERPRAPATPTTASNALVPLSDLATAAAHYVEQAHADNTRRAYQGDWRAFETWCSVHSLQALPASSQTLELYLTHLARRGLKASTIRRARIAIGLAHGHADEARPDKHARIRALERGIGRVHGAREEGAVPLLDHQIEKVVAVLGRSPHDERDRALILLGFAGGFRASELAGLQMEDLTFGGSGLFVDVRRSKADQLALGVRTEIRLGKTAATCPVRALETWIARVGRPSGPLFRVVRGTIIEHERIHPRAVTRAVQRAVVKAKLERDYSAHSLRSGMATSAHARGATRQEIQQQGRWKALLSVDRYIHEDLAAARPNIAAGLL